MTPSGGAGGPRGPGNRVTGTGLGVRALFGAAAVPGAEPPYDRVQIRVHYPAVTPSGEALDTGLVAVDTGWAPLPVVVIAGGVNCGQEAYQWLAHGLASRGFAAVTYTHTAVMGPGRIGLLPEYGASGPDSEGRVTGAVLAAVADLAGSSLLADALALDRVALVGHSAGGRTALYLTQHEVPGLRAVAVYGAHTALPGPDGTPVFASLRARCPVLVVSGGADGVVSRSRGRYGADPTAAWEPAARTFHEALPDRGGENLLVDLPAATHFTFVEPGDPATGREFLEEPDAEPEAHRAVLLTLFAAFLGRHLHPDDGDRPAIPAVPGINIRMR